MGPAWQRTEIRGRIPVPWWTEVVCGGVPL
ncbi:unnamed protein product [Victoria cruziana]